VSRQRFKEWHPESASGKRLLNACLRLVNASGKDNAEVREQGVEALSVLCLKYEAKHRVLKEAVKSVCELSQTGNEESSFWLGIANVLHELSTSEHEKNAELGRDMDITADHFETLQRINNMKKDQAVAENLDVEARIHERIAEMVRCGACSALCRVSSATSKRTREMVLRTMINFCKYFPARLASCYDSIGKNADLSKSSNAQRSSAHGCCCTASGDESSGTGPFDAIRSLYGTHKSLQFQHGTERTCCSTRWYRSVRDASDTSAQYGSQSCYGVSQ